MKRLFLIGLLLTMASHSFAIFPPLVSKLSHYQFMQVLVKNNQDIKNVDEFLSLLQKPFFDYYVLMQESESLQDASVENPDAIVFTDDGNFIMSFNGDAKHGGHEELEMIQFNHHKNAFEFFEISFTKNKPEISEINPSICLGCHGDDPRPIWTPYPFWKGAFGEEAFESGNPNRVTLTSEQRYFLSALRPNHPRYKHLKAENDDLVFFTRNVFLNHLIYQNNFKRIKRIINNTDNAKIYLKALKAALLCYADRPAKETLYRLMPKKLADDHLHNTPQVIEGLFEGDNVFRLFAYLFASRGIDVTEWDTILTDHSPRSPNRFSTTFRGSKAAAAQLGHHLFYKVPGLHSENFKLSQSQIIKNHKEYFDKKIFSLVLHWKTELQACAEFTAESFNAFKKTF